MPSDLHTNLKADILIIDDTPDNLRLLNQILSKYYKVRLAPSGASGLTAARSAPPDLILLDVMMPDLNGYEVAAQLKAGPLTSEIPIIFISALDDTESKVQGFEVGGVDYVTKPFQEKEVLARVNTHLSLRRLYKQAQAEIAERKRAEESLRKREQEYKTLVENTPDVIVRFDRQYRHIYVNPIVEKEFGTPPAVLLGKSHRELGQPPEMADWSENMIREVFETGREVVFELTSPTPTGEKSYLTRGVPEFAEDGTVLSVLFIHRNITERKLAEESIKESEEKYHKIFNNEIDAICIFDVETRKILDVNNAYLKLYGYTRDEVLQLTTDDISAENEKTSAAIQKAKATGDVVIPERNHRKKDGTVFQVELSAGAYTWKGRHVMFALARDITERKQAEEREKQQRAIAEALRETAEVLNSSLKLDDVLDRILDNVEQVVQFDAMNIAWLEEKHIRVLRSRGYTPEMEKVTFREEYTTDQLPTFTQVIETRQPLIIPDTKLCAIWKTSPKTEWVRSHIKVPIIIEGKVAGTINLHSKTPGFYNSTHARNLQIFANQVAIAVTNAKFAAQLEEHVAQRTAQLELAIKELESLSYTVSHDLRSPLRAIVGYSNIIQHEYADALPPEAIRLLGLMGDNAQFMGKMVDGLLNFMHLNRKALNIKTIEPAQLIRQALDTLGDEQAGRKIELVIQELPPCQGDQELLLDAWSNLLSNALKFSRPREIAHIEVGSITSAKDAPIYYVKDNGVGFDMRYSKKLFKVFHRLHHVHEFEGIGMGLALTQRIIQRHGGRIWAEAEMGKGATFYFTLPPLPIST